MPKLPRVSVRKKHGFCLGRTMVVLRVGAQNKIYRAHEDLLCASSPLFREHIQPNRQDAEGDCSICHEELLPGICELEYCRASCGGNFHASCLDKWEEQAAPAVAKCPLCRHDLTIPPARTRLLRTVSERAFDIYIEWLYRSKILVGTVDDEDWLEDLVEAYTVGLHLEDQRFNKAILQSIVEVCVQESEYPSLYALQMAYEKTPGPCNLRDLLVGLYAESDLEHAMDGIDTCGEEMPTEFWRDLTSALIKRRADAEDYTVESLTTELLPDLFPSDE
ncbi:hypothetical protein EKO04_000449 [Ascochyta lentis]|uniref:RING-type domain-containing protein n=1 Tax=Ascochyta lentis TaxID=205686 RepID=A0A8H7MMD0_9PLEO|nr:hypothetical protein EKO04_000449 [Ascochyta lentis]